MEPRHTKRKPQTHFAQIPVKIVKQMTQHPAPRKTTSAAINVIVESSADKSEALL